MPACPARRSVVRGVYWIRTLQTGRLMTRVRHLLNKGEEARGCCFVEVLFFFVQEREKTKQIRKGHGTKGCVRLGHVIFDV
jgi:hypothetical protein